MICLFSTLSPSLLSYHSVRVPLSLPVMLFSNALQKQPMTSSQTRPLWASPACRKSGLGNLRTPTPDKGWAAAAARSAELQTDKGARALEWSLQLRRLPSTSRFPLCYPGAYLCGEQEGKGRLEKTNAKAVMDFVNGL